MCSSDLGPALDWLKSEVEGTGTVFTGFLDGDELAAAYASGDVFAFPSDSETLGFAALEAMAAGVPVVAARAGGIPHVVEDGRTGILVEPGSADELAEGIRRLSRDKDLARRLTTAGRQEAERWSWTASAERLVEFYRQALRLRGWESAKRA